jgi:hypothetical protein
MTLPNERAEHMGANPGLFHHLPVYLNLPRIFPGEKSRTELGTGQKNCKVLTS